MTAKKKPHNNRLAVWSIYSLVALFAVGTVVTTLEVRRLHGQLRVEQARHFAGMIQEGKACGLLTRKEASSLLGQEVTLQSASIIPPSNAAASSNVGNPRIDSCTYTSPQTDAVYADVVVKTYLSAEEAKQAYVQEVDRQLFVTNVPIDSNSPFTELRYGAGVHYGLAGAMMVEVSAKTKKSQGASFSAQDISKKVFDAVASKLG